MGRQQLKERCPWCGSVVELYDQSDAMGAPGWTVLGCYSLACPEQPRVCAVSAKTREHMWKLIAGGESEPRTLPTLPDNARIEVRYIGTAEHRAEKDQPVTVVMQPKDGE